jgi:predicted glycosyltransferase
MTDGERAARRAAPSVMFYCHDAYGIGHLKRALTLGRYLSTRWPTMTRLTVTSSSSIPALAAGSGADYVKLPSIRRVTPGASAAGFVPRVLPIPAEALRDMRRDMLLGIVRHFHPDLVIVDYLPAGLAGELEPTLRHLRATAPGTRLIAGLRDIVGEAARVRNAWSRDGVYEVLEELYDLILVYGQPDIYDVVEETGLSPRVAAKTRYTGYLGCRPDGQAPPPVRERRAPGTRRQVLVTAGGGSDGFAVLQPMLEARRRWPERASFDCRLVGGPLMSPADRRRLEELVPDDGATRFIEHVDDLVRHLSAADVVVSRGGYNTICEILSFERPAIIVPRETIDGIEDTEQLMRARALSRRGLVRVIREADLTPACLLEAVNELLETPPPAGTPVALDGLSTAAAELDALLAR